MEAWLFIAFYAAVLLLMILCCIKMFKFLQLVPDENEDFLFVEDPGIMERTDLGGGYK
jgi:hypothetical protein